LWENRPDQEASQCNRCQGLGRAIKWVLET